MNWEAIWAGTSAVAAVLSIAGGAIAWWRSTYSKAAKSDAEDARDYTRRIAEALETAAASLRNQPAGKDFNMTTEPLTITHLRNSLYRLQNNTDEPVLIEQIDNADRFVRLDLKPGTEIQPHDGVEFLIAGAWGMPVPGELVVGLAQADDQTRIAIPPKP